MNSSSGCCLTLNSHVSKTAVTRGAFDEMFNDAWVSAPLRPGPSACNEASPPRDPQARVWASSGGNGPLGAIHNPTRARSAALLCQVLKERFLKVQRPYVAQPHRGGGVLSSYSQKHSEQTLTARPSWRNLPRRVWRSGGRLRMGYYSNTLCNQLTK